MPITAQADGYALVDQEVELGMRPIAVPLFDTRGRTVAAMNIGPPASQAQIEELADRYLNAMWVIQAELRKVLTYNPLRSHNFRASRGGTAPLAKPCVSTIPADDAPW